MKILKFGGTSVANAENINKLVDIVAQSTSEPSQTIVIVSALGGITNLLINLSNLAFWKNDYSSQFKEFCERHNKTLVELTKDMLVQPNFQVLEEKYLQLKKALDSIFAEGQLENHELDFITSFGEQISSYIVCQAFINRNINCLHIDSREVIKTDDNFGAANVNFPLTNKLLRERFKNNASLTVMGGFISSTLKGETSVLGRGGSDYTASIVGAALNAELIEIWTDVDGLYSSDPRKIKGAKLLSNISYAEAGELAFFGAKVIHPKTILPAQELNIPVYIKNTFNPNAIGSRICADNQTHPYAVSGITALNDFSIISIQAQDYHQLEVVERRILNFLKIHNIEIIVNLQIPVTLSYFIGVKRAYGQLSKDLIDNLINSESVNGVSIVHDLALVAIVGAKSGTITQVMTKVNSVLDKLKIQINGLNHSSLPASSILAIIPSYEETRVIKTLHEVFFEDDKKVINLFLVGVGLIGKSLLKQLEELQQIYDFNQQTVIKVIGIANSSNMLINDEGINLNSWQEDLINSAKSNLDLFINQMLELNLLNSVFIDCTASSDMTAAYEKVLNGRVAIVTPNKKVTSGNYDDYNKLKSLAKNNDVGFCYNTNVGAGLPIIHTIDSLIASGDKIHQVEAILSGSLSYIFTTFFATEQKFSAVVQEACLKGYTEPDPRDDLSGIDMARKILIISRELGLITNLNDVKVTPILNDDCLNADSLEVFLVNLAKMDDYFDQLRQTARSKNCIMRYIASYKDNQLSLSLLELDVSHPFYSLQGSDNIIAINSMRYHNTSLVIKGPGAGAEVTSAGIIADILKVIN